MAENKDDVNLIDFNNDFDVDNFQDYHSKRNTSPRKIRDNLDYYKLNKNKPIYETEKIIIQMPNNIVKDNTFKVFYYNKNIVNKDKLLSAVSSNSEINILKRY